MASCPTCHTEAPDPAEPGDLTCLNSTCRASFHWPPPQVNPLAQAMPLEDQIRAMPPDQKVQLLADLKALVNDQPSVRSPKTTPLKGDNLTHTTEHQAARVTVTVIAPDTESTPRARPTINGAPVAAGSYVYEAPGVPIVVRTRSGINDVVVIEEWI